MRKIRKIYLVVVLAVFILLFSGCNLVRKSHVTITDHNWQKYYLGYAEQWYSIISGTVVNDGDYYLHFVEIQAAVYDVNDNILDEGSESIWDFRRHQVYLFYIVCETKNEPDHYKVWVGRIDK